MIMYESKLPTKTHYIIINIKMTDRNDRIESHLYLIDKFYFARIYLSIKQ